MLINLKNMIIMKCVIHVQYETQGSNCNNRAACGVSLGLSGYPDVDAG